MKKKLMRTLVALVLACALVMPAACNTNGKNAEPSLTFEKTSIALKLEVNETEDVKFTATKLEEITFESDKPLVATGVLNEDSTALTVTAKRPGSAKITAKTETKDLAVLNVTVTQDVKITANATLDVDLESQTSTISFALNDSSATVTAKSENPAVVETGAVDLMKSTVALTPKSTGTANVVLTAKNANSEDTATVAVTVKDMYDTAPTDIFTFEDDNNGGWIISITDVEGYIESIAADDDDLEAEGATLIIPSTYNEKPVTEIKANFLKTDAAPNLAELYLPASVKVIGESAFEGCAFLKTVHIKSGSALETIGDKAFKECSSLSVFDGLNDATFSVCANLKTIGVAAFYHHNFSALYFPKSVTTIGTIAFAQNYLAALAGGNATALELVEFEEDTEEGWEERAVSLNYGPKDALDPTGIVLPYDALGGTAAAINGVFASNQALATVYLRNIKFCASLTFYNCALTKVYIDEKCERTAFAYDGSKQDDTGAFPDGQWITGNAFYCAFPECHKAAGTITADDHKTVLIIDNEAMMTTIGSVASGFAGLPADDLGILGSVDGAIGTSASRIWYVYVKEGIEPSQSFKDGYAQQESSDVDGYTYWVWKQA